VDQITCKNKIMGHLSDKFITLNSSHKFENFLVVATGVIGVVLVVLLFICYAV